MKLILQEDVSNLGKIGDHVKVKSGYARNFLIPHQKAVVATEENIKIFEAMRHEFVKQAGDKRQQAEQRAEQLKVLELTVECKAGEEGQLFGSVGPREVVAAVVVAGQALQKNEVNMPDGPIRHTGDHIIFLKLHSDVSVELSIKVVAAE